MGREELDGIDCIVVEVTYGEDVVAPEKPDGPITLWVDEARHLVMQEQFLTQMNVAPTDTMPIRRTMRIHQATINDSLPDALFTFEPSMGATEVSSGALFEQNLVGQSAPDFTLTDLDGGALTLESLRGRVVLLDFWATWCPPCVEELPRVQALHDSFPDDLVVLGINNEQPGIAREYTEKNGFTFRTLSDVSNEVAADYEVEAIPTVFVIDRAGKIVEHYVGARSEEDLRAALAKAGLE